MLPGDLLQALCSLTGLAKPLHLSILHANHWDLNHEASQWCVHRTA